MTQHKKLQNVYCKATNEFVTMCATMAKTEKSSEKLNIEFGSWLKSQRNAAGLTQGAIAKSAPIDRVHLARIESGESGTKRDTVISRFSVMQPHTAELCVIKFDVSFFVH